MNDEQFKRLLRFLELKVNSHPGYVGNKPWLQWIKEGDGFWEEDNEYIIDEDEDKDWGGTE